MIILTWILLSIVVGIFASNMGRGFFIFLFLSIMLSPLISGIILLCIGKNRKEIEFKEIMNGNMKKCPKCAELIKKEATICRFCGNNNFSIKPNYDNIKI